MQHRNVYASTVLFLAVLVLSIVILARQSETNIDVPEEETTAVSIPPPPNKSKKIKSRAQKEDTTINEKGRFDFGLDTKAMYGQKWLIAHGYDAEALIAYSTYGVDTLKALAESGDSGAQTLLIHSISQGGLIAHTDPNSIPGVIESLMLSAAYGNTAAIEFAVVMFQQRSKTDPKNKVEHLIDAYSWILVSQIRSDPYGVTSSESMLGSTTFSISENDIAIACVRANEIYSDLQQKRREMTFDEFDNRPPDLSPTDLSISGSICKDWPVERLSCTEAGPLPSYSSTFTCHK